MEVEGRLLFCWLDVDCVVLDLVDDSGSPFSIGIERPATGALTHVVEALLVEWAEEGAHVSLRLVETGTTAERHTRADLCHERGTRVSGTLVAAAGLS